MLMLMLTNTMETEEAGNTAGERGFNSSHLNHGVGEMMLTIEREGCLRKRRAHVFLDLGDLV